jgi:hypothetical protein
VYAFGYDSAKRQEKQIAANRSIEEKERGGDAKLRTERGEHVLVRLVVSHAENEFSRWEMRQNPFHSRTLRGR